MNEETNTKIRNILWIYKSIFRKTLVIPCKLLKNKAKINKKGRHFVAALLQIQNSTNYLKLPMDKFYRIHLTTPIAAID